MRRFSIIKYNISKLFTKPKKDKVKMRYQHQFSRSNLHNSDFAGESQQLREPVGVPAFQPWPGRPGEAAAYVQGSIEARETSRHRRRQQFVRIAMRRG